LAVTTTIYSVTLRKLNHDQLKDYIFAQLDSIALAHSTFTDEALELICRSSEGILRHTRNLCVSALIEAVRDRTQIVDLDQVNRVLMQPHWRCEKDVQAIWAGWACTLIRPLLRTATDVNTPINVICASQPTVAEVSRPRKN